MHAVFEDFLTKLDRTRSDEEVWLQLCETANSIGFNNVIYMFYPNNENEKWSERSTYSREWIQYWVEQGYHELDIPAKKVREIGSMPLKYDAELYLPKANDADGSEAVNVMWEARAEAGVDKLYEHQLFSDDQGSGLLGMVSSQMNSKEFEYASTTLSPLLSSLIYITHARIGTGFKQLLGSQVPVLSPRQIDILAYIANGFQYKQISHELDISENTVAFHMAELRKRLGCKNSREILGKAYRLGLIHKM